MRVADPLPEGAVSEWTHPIAQDCGYLAGKLRRQTSVGIQAENVPPADAGANRQVAMRELLLKELQFSCAVVLGGDGVEPRLRIVTPEAVMVVFLPLPDEFQERARRMSLMRGWMAWKMATSFILSAETKEPDGVMAIWVTRTDCWGVLRPIVRKPLSIGPEQWLTRAEIGEGFSELLPKGETTLDWETIAELERTFGPQGEFPVQLIN